MKKITLLGLMISLTGFACQETILPAFSADNYPDMPFNHFAAGDLGIITPQLATSYLIVAYRYLNIQPLDAAEQTAVLDTWHDYFETYPDYLQPVYPRVTTTVIDTSVTPNQVIRENKAYFNWRAARLYALGLPTSLPTPTHDINNFYETMALKEDNIEDISAGPGFNYLVLATKRLHAIEDALDKNINKNELLSLWISAQQQIFSRTRVGSEKSRALLTQLPANLPQLVKDDVQYSIAASYLYDGTPVGAEAAAKIFETLAHNDAYPWHEWAKYLQYRALNIAVNDMTQSDDVDTLCAENTPCRNLSNQSYEGMLDLSKHATNPKIKEASADYVNILDMRLKWRGQKIYNALLQKSLTHINKNSFTRLILLSNHLLPSGHDEISSWLADVIKMRGTKLTDTLFNDAYTHWKKNSSNLSWLWLAVYTLQNGDINQQNALTKAVLNLTTKNPGFIPLRVALIAHFDDLKTPAMTMRQKRDIIDATLAILPAGFDFSTTKLLLNARAYLASSLSDFITHAFFYPKDELLAFVPQADQDTEKTHYSANYIVANAAAILNNLPPSMLIKIANSPDLPNNYRPVIFANLWVRSILFNDTMLEKRVSTEAMKYNPVLADTLTKMAKTHNPDERKTLFLSALLHYPNLSPIINLTLYETWRANDLDNPDNTFNSIRVRQEPLNTTYNNWLWRDCGSLCKTPSIPGFLTPKERMSYQAQQKHFAHLKSATHYIGDNLIALANRHPQDLRYAELLALFINYTQYTRGGSKAAFVTLKRRYPNTPWAKNTKYYY